jgi:hypothetical protein
MTLIRTESRTSAMPARSVPVNHLLPTDDDDVRLALTEASSVEQTVRAWHNAGHSQRAIARERNLDRSKVKRIIDQAHARTGQSVTRSGGILARRPPNASRPKSPLSAARQIIQVIVRRIVCMTPKRLHQAPLAAPLAGVGTGALGLERVLCVDARIDVLDRSSFSGYSVRTCLLGCDLFDSCKSRRASPTADAWAQERVRR